MSQVSTGVSLPNAKPKTKVKSCEVCEKELAYLKIIAFFILREQRANVIDSSKVKSRPRSQKSPNICVLWPWKRGLKVIEKFIITTLAQQKKIALFLNFAMRVSCVKSWRCGWEGVKVSQAHDYETVLWRQCVSTGYSLFRWTANGTVPKTLGGQVQWKVSFSEKDRLFLIVFCVWLISNVILQICVENSCTKSTKVRALKLVQNCEL